MHSRISPILILTLPLLLSCAKTSADRASATESERRIQTEAHDKDLVSDSARLYWEAVRWGDGSKAASFLEDSDQRLVFEAWLEDQKEIVRYEDVQVLQVQLHPEEETKTPERLRVATAHIRVKSYALPGQVLKSETLKQEWYKSTSGWWINWEPTED